MADSKLTALAAVTSWASGDLLYLGSDPAGTPASKKITLDNVLANVVSRLTVSKNGAADAPPVAITGSWFSGGSATTTKPQLLVEAAGATSTGWATAGTGLGVNAASGFAGNLIDAQVNGASNFKVDSTGRVFIVSSNAYTSIGLSVTNSGIKLVQHGGRLTSNSYTRLNWSTSGANDGISVNNSIGLGPTASAVDISPDVFILRDAANTLALRNGANAQKFHTYFSWADASNYTRLAMKTAAGIHTLETESAGTGESNIDLAFIPKGTGAIRFGTHAALSGESVTGYITIKDAGGTSRKIAVVS